MLPSVRCATACFALLVLLSSAVAREKNDTFILAIEGMV